MEIAIRIQTLKEIGMKRPEVWSDFLEHGTLAGDSIRISRRDFNKLNEKHFGRLGTGNIVHSIVAPIASILDRIAGSSLEACGCCAERQLKLNLLTRGHL